MTNRTTGPVTIDGKTFTHTYAAYKRYRELGGLLTDQAFSGRIKAGMRTWAELNAPANPTCFATGRAGGLTTSAKRKAAKDEMSALLRELDERKRKIKGGD